MTDKMDATGYVIEKLNNANENLKDILENTDNSWLSEDVERTIEIIENILVRISLSGYKFYKFKVFYNRNTINYEYVKTSWIKDSFESEDEFVSCLLSDKIIDEDTVTFTCEITEIDEDEYVTATGIKDEPIIIQDFREV